MTCFAATVHRPLSGMALAITVIALSFPHPMRAQAVDLAEVPGRFILDARPPRPSDRHILPGAFLADGMLVLGDVAHRLEEVLPTCGFASLGWYLIHSEGPSAIGFAVFTRMEQVTADGRRVLRDGGLLARLWRTIAGSPPLYYRSLAIYVTESGFARDADAIPTFDRIGDVALAGSSTYFPAVLNQQDAGRFRGTVLLYLFKRTSASGETTLVRDESVNLLQHFNNGGLDPILNLKMCEGQ